MFFSRKGLLNSNSQASSSMASKSLSFFSSIGMVIKYGETFARQLRADLMGSASQQLNAQLTLILRQLLHF